MLKVYVATAQLTPERVIEGFYTLDGDELIMTYADGSPVMLNDGQVKRKLTIGEDARVVASRLTKEIRKAMLGDIVPGFSDPIAYANQGYV
jgi:hypothetical protein